jgi:hypothetical protein
VSHVRYELGFYMPEDGILHSHRRDFKSCIFYSVFKLNDNGVLYTGYFRGVMRYRGGHYQ